ncbi:MAG: hypothetical protein IKW49_08735, partial [Opitutales bacterium]|nr:hypothetical protein [Opitutales bacterium]
QNFVPYNNSERQKNVPGVVSCFQNFVPYNDEDFMYFDLVVVSCFQNFVPYNRFAKPMYLLSRCVTAQRV